MTDSPAQKWQFGLAKLFWLQLAFTPLILGGAIGRSDLRNREMWLGAILVVGPALYATFMSVVFIPPQNDLSKLLHKRTVWGMVFGALYGVLLGLPFFLLRARYGHPLSITEIVLTALLFLVPGASLLALLGGIAAGTWTAFSPWVMYVFRKR
jgi:hypothetical protein